MVKYLPKDALKMLEKTLLYSKQAAYYNKIEESKKNLRRIWFYCYWSNCDSNSNPSKNIAKDLNMDERISKFKDQLKDEYVYRIPLKYFTDVEKINFS